MMQTGHDHIHEVRGGAHEAEQWHRTEPRSLSVVQYVAAVVRQWKLIAAVVAVVTGISAFQAFRLPNVYTSRTKFLPPQQQGGMLTSAAMQGALAAVGGGDLLGASKATNLYVEMLKIDSIREPLIKRFGLQKVYGSSSRDYLLACLSNAMTVTGGKEGIITVSVDDTDPRRAAEIANAAVEELKKLAVRMNMNGAGSSKEYLEGRLAKAREELVASENELKAFQGRYKTLDAVAQAATSTTAIAQLTSQLTSQEIQLSVARRTHAETSQKVKTLRESIDALKERIARLQGGGVSSAQPGMDQLPGRGQEYLHLMRRFKTAEATVEMLTKQYEMAKINADNDVSTIQVLQPAVPPERKSGPFRAIMLIKAFVLSLMVGVALALVAEKIRTMPHEQKKVWKEALSGTSR